MKITNNESLTICGECGGECCLTKPGIESPQRFLSAADGPVESLYRELSTGFWVLDRHLGLPPGPDGEAQIPASEIEIYYPRPATRKEQEEGSIWGGAEPGSCSYLHDDRCMLNFDNRPLMCRALEPVPGLQCRSEWTRLDAARAWFPWQTAIQSVLARFGDSEGSS